MHANNPPRSGSCRRYICWDLDETLGAFRDYSNLSRRNGMKPLLEDLRGLGIGHVVTTAACREHAEYVLAACGIRHLFERIFPYTEICDRDYNKFYLPVASSLKIPASEEADRMLVMGDMWRDAPSDSGLTFFFQTYDHSFSSAIYREVITALMNESDSWADAHSRLQARNTHSMEFPLFVGGAQYVSGIGIGVGRIVLHRQTPQASNSVIMAVDVPDTFKADSEPALIVPDLKLIMGAANREENCEKDEKDNEKRNGMAA